MRGYIVLVVPYSIVITNTLPQMEFDTIRRVVSSSNVFICFSSHVIVSVVNSSMYSQVTQRQV